MTKPRKKYRKARNTKPMIDPIIGLTAQPFPPQLPRGVPVPKSMADTTQVGGNHYKAVNVMQEHWNLVVAYGWDYYTSQATRYLFRWRNKGGVQDLKKARHFIDKAIELVEDGWLPEWHPYVSGDPTKAYTNQG